MSSEVIYHITGRDAWVAAEVAGEYAAESLAREGFIHASTREQVVETANLFYAGQDGLVLLCVDPAKLMAPLKYEAPANPGHREERLFPHIYGPLNLDAVAEVIGFPCGADGRFLLPSELIHE